MGNYHDVVIVEVRFPFSPFSAAEETSDCPGGRLDQIIPALILGEFSFNLLYPPDLNAGVYLIVDDLHTHLGAERSVALGR